MDPVTRPPVAPAASAGGISASVEAHAVRIGLRGIADPPVRR
jgi:hypothetical protein